jgi:hypothetical protein
MPTAATCWNYYAVAVTPALPGAGEGLKLILFTLVILALLLIQA